MTAQRLENLGDEGVYRGEIQHAKQYFGGAIDAYVEEGDAESALRTCRKMIRLAPDVVRTRYTVVCLLAAQRQTEEARAALADYLEAVLETHTRVYAVPRLVLLGAVVEEPALREAIADALFRLDAVYDGEALLAQGRAAAPAKWPAPDPRAHEEQVLRLARL